MEWEIERERGRVSERKREIERERSERGIESRDNCCSPFDYFFQKL